MNSPLPLMADQHLGEAVLPFLGTTITLSTSSSVVPSNICFEILSWEVKDIISRSCYGQSVSHVTLYLY